MVTCLYANGFFHVVAPKPGQVNQVAPKSTDLSFRYSAEPWSSDRHCWAARGTRTIKNHQGVEAEISREILLFGWTVEEASVFARTEGLRVELLGVGVY
jgi:hypothetical protein